MPAIGPSLDLKGILIKLGIEQHFEWNDYKR